MDAFRIVGGHPLRGTVRISGSKNAALPILFSSLLGGEFTLRNVPCLRDIRTTLSLLRQLGIHMEQLEPPVPSLPEWTGTFAISDRETPDYEAPYDLVRTMRASVLCLGPLLARKRRARVSLPGGCLIGARPIDMHLKAFEKMGARITIHHGYIDAETDGLVGAEIALPYPTVTGTENILMAAVLASGTTTISNAAEEPEVADLAHFLMARGARISGAGSSTIRIEGVEALRETAYTIMFDRIEAGTFLVGAALLGDSVRIEGVDPAPLTSILDVLVAMGAEPRIGEEAITLGAIREPVGTTVRTLPYPGFPTDMQAQILPLMATASGSSSMIETVFENRFTHVMEMNRMGAEIEIHGSQALVRGGSRLEGAIVMASDLRASAGLVLAGLVAEGETEIKRVYHIDRGYESIERKLELLGARIKRVQEDQP
ncbi:MAG: UDP-N-acetylglucosamine 1-carboxyvinyltransferase [Nitrospiraceae bacterium]|nr:UDP-N-acetylglucosamine 1-carboxyvinyltransferase [Nitrospiraceae bacterium]